MTNQNELSRAAALLGRAGARALSPEQRRANVAKANKTRWARMSPEERSAYGRRMVQIRWQRYRQNKTKENSE